MTFPEQQPPIDAPVQEIPDQAEIPAHIEAATGVSAVPVVPQPIKSIGSQPKIQTVPAQATNKPQVQIPALNQGQLEGYLRARDSESKKWFGVFWLRKIKKAIDEGLSVIFGKQQ